MGKRTWAASFLVLLLLALTTGAAAVRSSRPKLQVIYEVQSGSHWQVFIFGLPNCQGRATVAVPQDRTQPTEIRCGK